MLAVENLSVNYGAIRALHQVSCRVEQGEIVALIGANGAGKTTILNTISGIVPSLGGSILPRRGDHPHAAHLIVRKESAGSGGAAGVCPHDGSGKP